jgi:hypothetical protein
MIKTYSEFLFESQTEELVSFISGITRAYNNDVYLGHFIVEEENRKWKEIRDNIQLRQTITFPAQYQIKFIQDDKKYNVIIEYNFSFFGQNELDVPDSSFDVDTERLGIVLDNIEIKKLKIVSQFLNVDTSNINDRLKEELVRFLIKVMSNDYDILSANLQTLQQEIYD